MHIYVYTLYIHIVVCQYKIIAKKNQSPFASKCHPTWRLPSQARLTDEAGRHHRGHYGALHGEGCTGHGAGRWAGASGAVGSGYGYSCW